MITIFSRISRSQTNSFGVDPVWQIDVISRFSFLQETLTTEEKILHELVKQGDTYYIRHDRDC